MKVVFVEDVPGSADAGETKVVKNGFARNYLLPRNLAVPATAGNLQRVRTIEKEAQEKRLRLSSDAQLVAGALEGKEITLAVRVGPTGRLFGAVTTKHIADELKKLMERELDHRSILLGEGIHQPGDYDVTVRLYRDVTSRVKVHVVPEGTVQEQAPAAAQGVGTYSVEPTSVAPDAAEPESEAEERP